VLASCKACWLAEPQLVRDVSSKLLADLQQLLPPLPAADEATTASAAADSRQQQQRNEKHEHKPKEPAPATSTAEDDSSEQVQDEQQEEVDRQEQQQKFMALLSCLVAILHAAGGLPSCRGLVGDAAALMAMAHERYSLNSAEDVSACEAAASLASLMLVLWHAAAGDVAAGAATGGRSDSDVTAAGVQGSSSSSSGTVVAGVFDRAWAAALRTLRLELLSNEDAVVLLDSMGKAISALCMLSKQQQQQQPQPGEAGEQQQQETQQQEWLQSLCLTLPVQLFSDTVHLR
jgi:hypothetical protein